MKEHFINLFEYNDWANRKIFYVLRDAAQSPKKILDILSHIILSQETWLGRVKGDYTNSFWENVELSDLKKRSEINSKDWLQILSDLDEKDLDKKYTYHNTKGARFETSLKDIITHLINHSSYHRAQINLLLRQNNVEPAITDYIYYTRR